MGPAALIPIAVQLAQYAPALLRYLGVGDEPVAVVEKITDMAQTVTGAKTPEEALAAIRASVELQSKFKLAALEQESEFLRLYMADRADARARDREFIRAGRWNYRADLLAFLAVGGLIICVWLIADDAGLPERAVNAIMFVAGVFASAVRDVFGYEFGSSRGSEQKQEQLASLVKTKM